MKNLESKIVESVCLNPWYNLALEEYYLREMGKEEIFLLLWRNKKTVVIGRNLNPGKECRCQLLEEENGRLARRISGGGAVYQDKGCLNYAFLAGEKSFKLEFQLRIVLRAVQSLDIRARLSGHSGLTVGGKIGCFNFVYQGQKNILHHGTILVNCSLGNRERYLAVPDRRDSTDNQVANLARVKSGLATEQVRDKLVESFIEIYGGEAGIHRYDPREKAELRSLYDRYSSREWRYGDNSAFDVTYSTRFDWGKVELGLTLKRGRIERVVIYSNTGEVDLIEKIAAVIEGAPFCLEAIVKRLDLLIGGSPDNQIVNDIKVWLKSKI
ncbi:MAG: lipoyl protein ligase domain-containing protein [Halanaerobiaceae bacterium]